MQITFEYLGSTLHLQIAPKYSIRAITKIQDSCRWIVVFLGRHLTKVSRELEISSNNIVDLKSEQGLFRLESLKIVNQAYWLLNYFCLLHKRAQKQAFFEDGAYTKEKEMCLISSGEKVFCLLFTHRVKKRATHSYKYDDATLQKIKFPICKKCKGILYKVVLWS